MSRAPPRMHLPDFPCKTNNVYFIRCVDSKVAVRKIGHIALPQYMLKLARSPLLCFPRGFARPHVRVMSVTSPSTTTKRKMVQIGTHNGSFHCDEALGCYLLQKTDRFKDSEVVRSRDPVVLKDLDIVIDVGGIYDPSECLMSGRGIVLSMTCSLCTRTSCFHAFHFAMMVSIATCTD